MPNKSHEHFQILAETDVLLAGHEYAYLSNKKTKQEIYIGDFYGDPKFALISKNNDWCVFGGEHLTLWQNGKEIIEIDDEKLAWSIKARQVSETGFEVLIDPWSAIGAVWLINVLTLKMVKQRDFFCSDTYEEDFEW